MEISEIDVNFDFSFKIPDNTVYFDCFDDPIEINGLYEPKKIKKYLRLPEEFEKDEDISPGVRELIHNTAGGRVRFATDSLYVVIMIELSDAVSVSHFSPLGHSGADIFISERGKDDYLFKSPVLPPAVIDGKHKKYGGMIFFSDYDRFESHEVMIDLPPYNGVNSIYIGIGENSKIYSPVPYRKKKPVYFYGASITQGACASRPGNNYPNLLSRWLSCDFYNLGFSGNAKGEKKIANYLAGSDAAALVIDMDISANDIEIFKNTHYPFYEEIRKSNKSVPLIFLSFPKYPKIHHPSGSRFRDHIISNRIICETCIKAWQNGDENVYYIDGETLFGTTDQDFCTVDYSHPNDYGFYKIAEGLYPTLKKII